MSQCTPDCPNDAQIPIQVEPGGNNQIIIKTTIPIPPGTSKVTLKGKDDILQQLDKIICKADDEDSNFTLKSIDNGKCLEFTFTPRQTAIQTLSCTVPNSAFDLGPDPPHFCISPSSLPLLSSPTSPASSSPLSLTIPSLTLSTNLAITSMPMHLTSSSDISTVTVSPISIFPTLLSPSETPGTSTANSNKATTKASLKDKVAGEVLVGISIALVIFILWRLGYRRLRNIPTLHQKKQVARRITQRSSLRSSVSLTPSMIA